MAADCDRDLDRDLVALAALGDRLTEALRAVGTDQLSLATPCSDWDLAALIDHVTGGNWFTIGILGGRTAEEAMTATMDRFAGGTASLVEAVSSVGEQQATFVEPGILDGSWSHIAGPLTGRQILRIRLHDLIIHTWDIEETIRPPASVAGSLAGWALTELSDPGSITADLFGLAGLDRPDLVKDGGAGYLALFGR